MRFPRLRGLYGVFCAFLIGFSSPVRTAGAAELPLDCRLVFQTAEGVYVDVGSGSGVLAGDKGWIRQGGEKIADFVVDSVSDDSAFLRIAGPRPQAFPETGDAIAIVVENSGERPKEGAESAPRTSTSSTLKDRTQEGEAFVPLLAPPNMRNVVTTDEKNLFHGKLSLRQMFQVSDDDDLDYFRTRFNTSGSLDRIGGSPWSLEWSAALSYRDGDALENTRDYQEIRPELYQLSLFRRFDDKSFVRVGRFIPRELPSVGFLDGVQGERVLTKKLRVGAMAGLKPERDDLNFTFDEPTLVPYLTYESGQRLEKYYSATAGVLFSIYEGAADRLSLLLDQTAHFGKLSLFSSSEVDFDTGSAEEREGTRVTRLDVLASYPVATYFTLRIGVDRYERPDTAAERDLIDPPLINEDEFFDRGYWRYFVGGTHKLPGSFFVSEEVSWIDSPDDNYTLRWNASLTRTGLPGMPSASLTLSVYNLEGDEVDGFGGRLGGHFPILGHRLSLEPSLTMRLLQTEIDDEDLLYSDASLRAYWVLSSSTSLFGGAAYSFDDEYQRIFLDVGINYRW